jgi:phage protein D
VSKNSNLISKFHIKIGGADVSPDFMRDLLEVTVENSLHMPDAVTLILNDPKLKWIDDASLSPGKTVEVSATAAEQGSQARPIFDGEIVELEPEFGNSTHRLFVRGFDRLHRLSRGRRVRSFQNVTDSDIAERLAKEAGLQTDVEQTKQVHPYLFQSNQTNLEFLRQRASAVGYLLYVMGKKLCFKPVAQGRKAVDLKWGGTLSEFRPRLTTIDQVSTITTRGWDPKSRKEIVSEVTSGDGGREIGEKKQGGQIAKEAFNIDAAFLASGEPVHEQQRADHLAKAFANRQAERFVEAEGACIGNPEIVAAASVKIESIGGRFSGTYFVTSATHTYDARQGFTTRFTISGQNPSTLLSVLRADHTTSAMTQGFVIGVVTDNQDPDGWGRVKVKYPWLSGDHTSDWARVVVVGGGPERGIEFLPEINDEVLVGFEMGDIHHPYIIGGLWNGKDSPPKKSGDVINGGRVEKRIIRSRTGHSIVFDDSDGSSSVTISDKKGNSITLDTAGNKIVIDAKGDLSIKAAGKIDIKGSVINLN